jgi:hypothetical protein
VTYGRERLGVRAIALPLPAEEPVASAPNTGGWAAISCGRSSNQQEQPEPMK